MTNDAAAIYRRSVQQAHVAFAGVVLLRIFLGARDPAVDIPGPPFLNFLLVPLLLCDTSPSPCLSLQ